MSELALRREAVGRKNWLFVGSDDGGAVNATFTSLLASAQLCKIEPWAYLRDLFCLLSNWPAHQMLDLAPLNWAQTSARKDVRALLAPNKFRDLTIDAGSVGSCAFGVRVASNGYIATASCGKIAEA
jgi:transposase